jgi:hypothetical protein
MRQLIVDNKDLWLKIEKIEQALTKKDEEVQTNNLKMIQFENLKMKIWA